MTLSDLRPDIGVDLLDLEMELEMSSLRKGIDRDRKNAEELEKRGEIASWTPHQRLIRGGLGMVSGILKCALEDTQGPHITILRAINPDMLAYAGLWSVVNGACSRSGDMRMVSGNAARLLEDYLWGEALREADAKMPLRQRKFAKVWNKIKKTHVNPRARKKALRPLAEKMAVSWEPWPIALRLRVGTFVINGVLRAGLAVLRDGDNGATLVDLSSDAHAALQDLTMDASWIRPINSPMAVAPKPWRGFDDGGYLSRRMQEMNPLVRHSPGEQRVLITKAIADGSMSRCLDALNIIQSTAWRINPGMLRVTTRAFEQSEPIKDFPRRALMQLPAAPADYDQLPEDAQRAFRRDRANVYRRNTTMQGQSITFRTDMVTANEVSKLSQFWIPHNLDFRGRVYPICYFSQQRGDYVRAMLEFARGVTVTPEGERWLMIHCANAGDYEKVSKRPFQERVDWVSNNIDMIRNTAREPFKNTGWYTADKPFEYLRSCIEIDALFTAKEAGREFVSHLPVSIDGSNSGLQHYSAILRSEDDGRHVNLVPQSTPADIYAAVAGVVSSAANADADPLAKLWITHGISRSTVKRNVMTFPYSSTAFGFRQQIMSDFMAPLTDEVIEKKRDVHPFGDDGGWAAAGWLASNVYAAVTATVSSATGAMLWMRKVAGVLAQEGLGVQFTSPVGFPVLHEYTDYDTKMVSLWLYDKSVDVVDASSTAIIKDEGVYRLIQSTVRIKPTRTIIKSRQKSAVAPNVIHAMDAAHLKLTAIKAADEGVGCFAMVHDSFGTHASHMPVLFRVVREQMAEMYENYDPLALINSMAMAALSERGQLKVPPLPERGNLDLKQIAHSQFAFA